MEQGPDQLRNWTASPAHKLAADETMEKFTFSERPQFKCVICKREIVRSPVFQCRDGHLTCSNCPGRGSRCTVCDNAVSGAIRSLAIEKIIDSLKVICKYENLGCKSTCHYQPYMAHERTCPFKPINCPMPDCKQAGVTNSLKQHLKSEHNISALANLKPTHYCGTSYPVQASFSLDSNITTKVLLEHSNSSTSKDYYLLHQVTTKFGDRLHLMSLPNSGKLRKYALNVEIKLADPNIKVEIQHCYKFESKLTDTFDHDGLLIPKRDLGDSPATSNIKKCRIRASCN